MTREAESRGRHDCMNCCAVLGRLVDGAQKRNGLFINIGEKHSTTAATVNENRSE